MTGRLRCMGEHATGRPGQWAWSSGLDVERRDRVSDGRGMALVITMMAMLTLLALTGALVPLASTETAVVANHRRAIQSFYAAEAALEFIVQELRGVPDWDELLTGKVRSRLAGTSSRVRLADGTVLDLQDATNQLEQTGAGATAAGRGLRWRLYAHGPLETLLPVDPSKGVLLIAVWLADDPMEIDGDPFRDTNDVLVVHAAVFGPAWAERSVQATVMRRATEAAEAGRPVSLTSWRLVR